MEDFEGSTAFVDVFEEGFFVSPSFLGPLTEINDTCDLNVFEEHKRTIVCDINCPQDLDSLYSILSKLPEDLKGYYIPPRGYTHQGQSFSVIFLQYVDGGFVFDELVTYEAPCFMNICTVINKQEFIVHNGCDYDYIRFYDGRTDVMNICLGSFILYVGGFAVFCTKNELKRFKLQGNRFVFEVIGKVEGTVNVCKLTGCMVDNVRGSKFSVIYFEGDSFHSIDLLKVFPLLSSLQETVISRIWLLSMSRKELVIEICGFLYVFIEGNCFCYRSGLNAFRNAIQMPFSQEFNYLPHFFDSYFVENGKIWKLEEIVSPFIGASFTDGLVATSENCAVYSNKDMLFALNFSNKKVHFFKKSYLTFFRTFIACAKDGVRMGMENVKGKIVGSSIIRTRLVNVENLSEAVEVVRIYKSIYACPEFGIFDDVALFAKYRYIDGKSVEVSIIKYEVSTKQRKTVYCEVIDRQMARVSKWYRNCVVMDVGDKVIIREISDDLWERVMYIPFRRYTVNPYDFGLQVKQNRRGHVQFIRSEYDRQYKAGTFYAFLSANLVLFNTGMWRIRADCHAEHVIDFGFDLQSSEYHIGVDIVTIYHVDRSTLTAHHRRYAFEDEDIFVVDCVEIDVQMFLKSCTYHDGAQFLSSENVQNVIDMRGW
ncbi:hypothetical protein PCE1_001771 [Barthelona sp. PCE]